MIRLALVLSGRGGAGAYAAGAVTELLRAIEENRSGTDVEVGVIAASGTGSLAAALAARSLAVNPALLGWIEPTWVEGLDADLALGAGTHDAGEARERLREMLGHVVAGPPATDDRPGRGFGGTLRVGLAAARGGAPGGLAGGGAPATGERDGARVLEVTAAGAGDAVWGELRDAVLDAAGLPVARALDLFPADANGRPGGGAGDGPSDPLHRSEVTGPWPPAPPPIELAARLAGRAPEARSASWRCIVVSPGTSPESSSWRDALWTEARFHALEELVLRLPEIHGRLDDPEAVGLGRHIGRLAEEVAEREIESREPPDGSPGGDPVLRLLDRRLERLLGDRRYEPAFGRVSSRAGRTRMAKLVYALEGTADLVDRSPLDLHLVAPGGDGPAGAFAGGLGGFLSSACRRHDFRLGRRDVRRTLEGPLSGVVEYPPAPDEEYAPNDAPASLDELPRDARRRLDRLLGAEADRLLAELRPRGLGGLLARLGERAQRRALVRRATSALERET